MATSGHELAPNDGAAAASPGRAGLDAAARIWHCGFLLGLQHLPQLACAAPPQATVAPSGATPPRPRDLDTAAALLLELKHTHKSLIQDYKCVEAAPAANDGDAAAPPLSLPPACKATLSIGRGNRSWLHAAAAAPRHGTDHAPLGPTCYSTAGTAPPFVARLRPPGFRH